MLLYSRKLNNVLIFGIFKTINSLIFSAHYLNFKNLTLLTDPRSGSFTMKDYLKNWSRKFKIWLNLLLIIIMSQSICPISTLKLAESLLFVGDPLRSSKMKNWSKSYVFAKFKIMNDDKLQFRSSTRRTKRVWRKVQCFF